MVAGTDFGLQIWQGFPHFRCFSESYSNYGVKSPKTEILTNSRGVNTQVYVAHANPDICQWMPLMTVRFSCPFPSRCRWWLTLQNCQACWTKQYVTRPLSGKLGLVPQLLQHSHNQSAQCFSSQQHAILGCFLYKQIKSNPRHPETIKNMYGWCSQTLKSSTARVWCTFQYFFPSSCTLAVLAISHVGASTVTVSPW